MKFIFPGRVYNNFGGADTLIINLNEGFKIVKQKILIIGKQCSSLYMLKNDSNANYIDFEEDPEITKYIEKEDICVLFGLSQDLFLIKSNPKIIYYCIHPDTFVVNGVNKLDKILKDLIFNRQNKKILINLTKKNALFFMDESCASRSMSYYKLNFKPSYLPIPIPDSLYLYSNEPITDFKITYVGRGEVLWKVYPLKKFVNDLISSTKLYYTIHIVSKSNENFRNELPEHPRIKYLYHDNIDNTNIRDFLKSNSNLHIGMGTSALEGSVMGIPTLLVDASQKEFPENYKYRWIFENKNYVLGYNIDATILPDGHDIEYIIQEMLQEDARSIISMKCYEYTKLNHNLSQITEILQSVKTEMRLEQLLKYSNERDFLYMIIKTINRYSGKLLTKYFFK